MTDNPYAPTACETTLDPQQSMTCRAMCLITAFLGVVSGGITVVSIYQYVALVTLNKGSLPNYVIAATFINATSTVLLFVSARSWRSSKPRLGVAFLVAASILFFGGPSLLLS